MQSWLRYPLTDVIATIAAATIDVIHTEEPCRRIQSGLIVGMYRIFVMQSA